MAQFEIESYEIETISRATLQDRRMRLVSSKLFHGIQHQAYLFFTSANEFPSSFTDFDAIGAVLNAGGLNFEGMTFFVWLRTNCFDEIIDILRNENPVFFRYGLANLSSNPDSTTKLVPAAGIVTNPEYPGEGAPDPDLVSAQVIDSLKVGS